MNDAYSKSAPYYDKLYAKKDYAGEVERLLALLEVEPGGRRLTLLDVACGTGLHLRLLSRYFAVEGLDLCPEQLEAARRGNPGIHFHQGDMTAFDLGRRFDVVTCLFSSIGYMKTLEDLRRALARMAAHLEPGGRLVVEPWFTPSQWRSGSVHALLVEEPELKIARMNTSFTRGRLSVFDLHHLVGTPQGTEHFVEHHEMGLFEVEEMGTAMRDAGLSVEYYATGLTGRGLYIGRAA
jgi:SAM-dependent methyltransferase